MVDDMHRTTPSSTTPETISNSMYGYYHVVVILEAICMFVIIATNVVIIAATVLVRKLHTPDNYIIAGLAMSDLLVGLWSVPMYIVEDLPETTHLIKGQRWTCGMKYSSAIITQECSLSLLFIMCVDRFLDVNFPFRYRHFATAKAAIITIVVVYVLEGTRCVVVYGILLTFDPSEPILGKRCNHAKNTPQWYNSYFMSIKQFLQISIAFCCCLQVIVVSLRQRRKISSQRAQGISGQLNASQRKEMKRQMADVKIIFFLMFLFVLLWAPTFMIPLAVKILGPRSRATTQYILLTKIPRLINSSVNAFVYALSRPRYRCAYKFLITTLPWRWGGINIIINKMSPTFFIPTERANPYMYPEKVTPLISELKIEEEPIDIYNIESQTDVQPNMQSSIDNGSNPSPQSNPTITYYSLGATESAIN